MVVCDAVESGSSTTVLELDSAGGDIGDESDGVGGCVEARRDEDPGGLIGESGGGLCAAAL